MRKRRRTGDPGWGFVLLIAALVGSLAMGLGWFGGKMQVTPNLRPNLTPNPLRQRW